MKALKIYRSDESGLLFFFQESCFKKTVRAVREGIQMRLNRYFVVALTIFAAGVIVLGTGFNRPDGGSKQPVIKQDHSMHSTEK